MKAVNRSALTVDLFFGQFDDDVGAVGEAAPVNSVPLRQMLHGHDEVLVVVLHTQKPAFQLTVPRHEGETRAAVVIVCVLFTPNSLEVFILGVIGTFHLLLSATLGHD